MSQLLFQCVPSALLLHFRKQWVLERLQAKALKAIYGYETSYSTLVEKSGLTTPRARREARELVFARKCATSARFARWFPRKYVTRDTRNVMQYEEEFARTDRCYNLPVFSMRRKLNKDTVEALASSLLIFRLIKGPTHFN